MRILPVLDLRDGLVVHGIAGQRDRYQPIRSTITTSTRPVDVAEAFRARFGLTEFYVADLGAITGAAPDLASLTELQQAGFRLWVDAGVHRTGDVVALVEANVARIILSLESLTGPEVLAGLIGEYGSDRWAFSLDLKAGQLLSGGTGWAATPIEVVEQVATLGVFRMIVLDLARVGMGTGCGTEGLIAEVRRRGLPVELIAGGGIRGVADLHRLRAIGADAVLVASALHDGRLAPDDLRQL